MIILSVLIYIYLNENVSPFGPSVALIVWSDLIAGMISLSSFFTDNGFIFLVGEYFVNQYCYIGRTPYRCLLPFPSQNCPALLLVISGFLLALPDRLGLHGRSQGGGGLENIPDLINFKERTFFCVDKHGQREDDVIVTGLLVGVI